MTEFERIERDEMFMEICHVVRKRSSCVRGHVGCVIVKDRRIVSMGYNGSPPGADHCYEVGCEEREGVVGCQRAIHAEANAIAFAARFGVGVHGGTMYCTHGPCHACAKLVVAAGLVEYVYSIPYREERIDVLLEGDVEVARIDG